MRIEITTRVVEERGIVLPWERWSIPPVFKDGKNLTPDRLNPPVMTNSGEVFISMKTLHELAEQDHWDSQFGKVLLLGPHEALALEAEGLAERETRGGFHCTDKLIDLMKAWGEL